MATEVAGDMISSGDFTGDLENVPYEILGDLPGGSALSGQTVVGLTGPRAEPVHSPGAGGARSRVAAAAAGGAR